ncbi:MAG TPA: molecular chaperone DnaK [Chloroflexota bacterium]|nr:molecular chaperone DnaK [Chloroflexota bacterium]
MLITITSCGRRARPRSGTMAKVIGIDLGTTNSAVAVLEGGEPSVLESSEGERITPSMVAINPKTGERLTGRLAKRQAVTNPENTVFSIKRFMGRKFDDPIVQEAVKRVPYRVTRAPNGDIRVLMGGKEYSPPEISAMILQKLKADAEAKLGERISQAVITVPAYFNDAQRQATKDAGQIAGLEVLRIVNEPTAASLAYGLDKQVDEVIAVYDLGGGTFDVSILRVGEGVIEVLATNGDTFLGGDDFDRAVIDWIIAEFKREEGVDLSQDRMALQRVREAAERAKVELSSSQTTEINLPFISATASGPKHLQLSLTRAKLEQLTEGLIERTREPVERALADAKLRPGEIDQVVLVGGQTRMPAVQDFVRKLFGGKEPHKGVNPDEVVAVGAAIQAGVLQGEVKNVLLLDVTPLSLGVETKGGVMTTLIPRNTTIPTSRSETFSTAEDNQSQVDIHVVQGERPMARENKSLGRFILDGILPAPRGVPQIEVTFDIDANGILNVSARDKGTGRQQKIVIQPSSGLTEMEIQRMMRDAQEHAAEDARRREEIELKNHADSQAYAAERMLRESGDRVPSDARLDIENQVQAVRQAIEQNDVARVRSASEALQAALQRAGSAVYGTQAGKTSEGESSAGDGTVEGEFREVA